MASFAFVANGKYYVGPGGQLVIAGSNDMITLLGGGNVVLAGDNDTITVSGGGNVMLAGDNATMTLSGGGNTVLAHDQDRITIYGGGNSVAVHDNGVVSVNDARSVLGGFSGSVNFGDTISVHNNDTVSLNYTLTLASSVSVSVGFQPSIVVNSWGSWLPPGGTGNKVNANFVVTAGAHDTITFSGANQAVSLSVGSGDTVVTTGANDTITIAGSVTTKSSMTVGATAANTTLNGGLGTDTFSAGSGYDGGNYFVGSARGYQDGFAGIGSCANYAPLACRVTVSLNTNVGQGFDAGGALLWTDTYSNIQQVKAGQLDGNVLTGSDAYYCELKGGVGSATYYGGAAGDRIIWSSAGATGLLDGQSTDVGYAGTGNDEFYWRNLPGGKGVSNLGERIYGFNTTQGDDLNLSELVSAGYAGVTTPFDGTTASLFTFVDVSLSTDGNDTNVWLDKTGSGNFTQLAAVLKNENLFTAFGVTDTSSVGAQQVVLDMYNTGHLVLTQPH